MSAIEQAEAYANDAECPVIARAHILALLGALNCGVELNSPDSYNVENLINELRSMVYGEMSELFDFNRSEREYQRLTPDYVIERMNLINYAFSKLPRKQFDEAKEREMFERVTNDSRFFPRALNFAMTKSPGGQDEYENPHLQSRWGGWLARARIATKE